MAAIHAFIPARAGSKRLQAKNIRPLAGHPLISYTISAAKSSGVFQRVLVSTDSPEIAGIALRYGAEVPFLRPAEMAGDLSPDIDWVRYTLGELGRTGGCPGAFALLRPTSPFRQPETIRRAWDLFQSAPGADSLRAVELCRQHPGKMWMIEDNTGFMRPLLDDGHASPPWHSSAYQSLPVVYAQNASLEIAHSRVPLEQGTIAGNKILPFLTEGYEGFDINKPEDFLRAESLVERGLASLPAIP